MTEAEWLASSDPQAMCYFGWPFVIGPKDALARPATVEEVVRLGLAFGSVTRV